MAVGENQGKRWLPLVLVCVVAAVVVTAPVTRAALLHVHRVPVRHAARRGPAAGRETSPRKHYLV